MGYPIRSNIFEPNSRAQRYFERFAVQVAVLFSPSDVIFADAFRQLFLELDRLTGAYVVFFAVLDPPPDWLTAARNRSWWLEYEQELGSTGFSMDDTVLIREIARLFGIPWDDLPAIVVSNNLWAGEYISSGTSAFHIELQLTQLANLARDWGQPNIGHIQTVIESTGYETTYHPPSEQLRGRLNDMYGVLGMGAGPGPVHPDAFRQRSGEQLRQAQIQVRRIRQTSRLGRPDSQNTQLEPQIDAAIEDAAGRLLAPATVAARVFQTLHSHSDFPIQLLDEESRIMIQGSVLIGGLLETVRGNPNLWRPPIGQELGAIDFTQGAQGVWKAFEREINLSVIQAARAARTVRMPDFFALLDAGLPTDKGRVVTPVGPKDINQKDWEHSASGRHRFLALGDSWHVTKTMLGSPVEGLDAVIVNCLGGPLPPDFMDAWKVVQRLRNKGSHTEPLSQADYEDVLANGLAFRVLNPMMVIKGKLSARLVHGQSSS